MKERVRPYKSVNCDIRDNGNSFKDRTITRNPPWIETNFHSWHNDLRDGSRWLHVKILLIVYYVTLSLNLPLFTLLGVRIFSKLFKFYKKGNLGHLPKLQLIDNSGWWVRSKWSIIKKSPLLFFGKREEGHGFRQVGKFVTFRIVFNDIFTRVPVIYLFWPKESWSTVNYSQVIKRTL